MSKELTIEDLQKNPVVLASEGLKNALRYLGNEKTIVTIEGRVAYPRQRLDQDGWEVEYRRAIGWVVVRRVLGNCGK